MSLAGDARKYLTSLLWFLTVGTYAQQSTDDLLFSKLTINDGLAFNTVFEVYEDSRGYIWIGAGTHLQRFDGNRFISFSHQAGNEQSLPFADIRSIFYDSKGQLWIGTDGGGVAKMTENGGFDVMNIDTGEGLSSNTIEHIIEMADGSLYMASWGGGINIYKDGNFTQLRYNPDDINSLPSDNVVDLYYDDESATLWIGTWGGGLCYLKDDTVHRIAQDESGYNSSIARTIEKSSDGTLWVGSWGDGLFRYKDGGFEHFHVGNGALEDNNVLSISTQDEKLWIGTWGGGLTLLENGIFRTYRYSSSERNSLGSDFIEASIIDRNGDLILGTFAGGITKVQQSSFTNINQFDKGLGDLGQEIATSIIEDAHGNIWASTRSGLYIINDQKKSNCFVKAISATEGHRIDLPIVQRSRSKHLDRWKYRCRFI